MIRYFGGYVGENFSRAAAARELTEVGALAHNSFTASFIDEEVKRRYLAEIDGVMAEMAFARKRGDAAVAVAQRRASAGEENEPVTVRANVTCLVGYTNHIA